MPFDPQQAAVLSMVGACILVPFVSSSNGGIAEQPRLCGSHSQG